MRIEKFHDDDMEEMDLKWQVAMISMRIEKFHKKTGRKLQFDTKDPVGFDKIKVECFNFHKIEHFTRDCRAKGNQDSRRRDVGYNGTKRETMIEDLHIRMIQKLWLPLMERILTETTTSMPEPVEKAPKVICEPKVWTDAPIIEEYESDSDNDSVFNVQEDKEKSSFAFTDSVKHVKTSRENVKETGTPNHSSKIEKQDRNGHTKKGLGYAFTRKTCFVCGSFSHLIRDCDFHEKRMAKQAELTKNKNKVTGKRVNRPVWNNVQRVNHQTKFVPSVLLTKTGKFPVNDARQNYSSQATSTSTASKVNTARSFVNETRPKRNFYKTHSPNKRPFHNITTQMTTFSYHKFNIVGNKSLSDVKENWDTAVKASAGCNWRNKRNSWNKVFNYNRGSKFRKSDDPHKALKDKEIVDNGCFRHMTGNKAHLADYQEFKGGSVAFGGSNGRITGKQHKASCKAKTDETTPILKDFIRQAENQFNHKVKTIRSDNGTEFMKNKPIEFCGLKGIKREYSNARTLQQNRVDERKNMTLIKAARTMLANLFLHTTFWAEAVNTACYVLNRVLVTKSQNKTPYELLTETKRVEENLHVNFLENKPNVAGKGYAWMFDLDYLTNSVNYEPVSVENQANKSACPKEANNSAGTQANDDQSGNSEEIDLHEEHFVLPICPSEGIFTVSSYDEDVVADFNNLETIMNVSPTPTTKIHTIHPKTQILRDPMLAVQTKSKVNKNSEAHALICLLERKQLGLNGSTGTRRMKAE
nr:hypothetical protein [Tanacetum cinerariifolium]